MKIAVIGAGTVGVLSVCHFLGYELGVNVTCIHNPKKNILGIGESSTVNMPKLLWETLNFNIEFDGQDLQYTFKTGVKFQNWRKHDFVSPIIPPSYAIHFDNFKLAEVVFSKIKKVYPKRFKELTVDIDSIEQNNQEVIINKKYKFDYIIDCRGFPKDYSNYKFENLPINHAIVHAVDKPGDWNFTYHKAHKNGWMFGIPLKNRQGWGYLYNDEITTKKEAVDNFNEITGKSINYENIREYSFKPFRANKFIDGRILLNGNSALFYEPIDAISGAFYDCLNRFFYDYIFKNKFNENTVNNQIHILADRYINFISFIYSGGSIYDTEFWNFASNICSTNLNNNVWLETINTINQNIDDATNWPYSPEAWYILDKNLYKNNNFNIGDTDGNS
jgi:hypothetical protein